MRDYTAVKNLIKEKDFLLIEFFSAPSLKIKATVQTMWNMRILDKRGYIK